jgi:hypothetical protein
MAHAVELKDPKYVYRKTEGRLRYPWLETTCQIQRFREFLFCPSVRSSCTLPRSDLVHHEVNINSPPLYQQCNSAFRTTHLELRYRAGSTQLWLLNECFTLLTFKNCGKKLDAQDVQRFTAYSTAVYSTS